MDSNHLLSAWSNWLKPVYGIFGQNNIDHTLNFCPDQESWLKVGFKMSFWYLQINHKNNEIFVRISVPAPKRGQIKKIRALYATN